MIIQNRTTNEPAGRAHSYHRFKRRPALVRVTREKDHGSPRSNVFEEETAARQLLIADCGGWTTLHGSRWCRRVLVADTPSPTWIMLPHNLGHARDTRGGHQTPRCPPPKIVLWVVVTMRPICSMIYAVVGFLELNVKPILWYIKCSILFWDISLYSAWNKMKMQSVNTSAYDHS
jgi:hypothetical protein